MASSLSEYKRKRKFDKTPEPGPKKKRTRSGRMFVIQKHRATALHYDFRLEVDGVLKSWAVPKGPSLDPKVRRLAMQVEDHPVDYAKFEGVIPEGDLEPEEALAKGDFKFTLEGEKLKGSWVLVRTRNRQWLLIKHRDYYTTTEDVTEIAPVSILSRRSLAEIAEDEGGDIKKAATGDPKVIPRRTGVKRRKKGAKAKVWHSNRAS
jgi:bifunctional non-homologous end joining protein LigD